MSTAGQSSQPTQARTPVTRAHLHHAAGSAVFAVVGIWSAWEGRSLGLFQFGSPAPGLFPFIFGVMLVAIALLSLGIEIFRMARAAPPAEAPEEGTAGGRKRVIGYLAIGVGCTAAMNWIGFVPAALLGILLLVRAIEGMSWRTSLLVAVGSAIVADLLFVRLLAVPLPAIPF